MTKKIFFIRKVLKIDHQNIWLKEEDELLISLVKNPQNKINWKIISNFLPNKSPTQCYRRYKSINPCFKKGRWSQEEDAKLKMLLEKYGNAWTYISELMGTRSNRQIRNRYDENLNPHVTKNKFTEEEDKLILQLHKIFHNNWSKYLNYLPNRCVKVIKRRFLRLLKIGYSD